MAKQPDREPFAQVAEWITDQINPKGPPSETTPLPVTSIEESAQLFADELQEQGLKQPLIDLLQDYQENPAVAGVGLVTLAGHYLSIRVLTDVRRGAERDNHLSNIGKRYDTFAQSLYDTLPNSHSVRWGLSYYNTVGGDVSKLIPELIEEISKETHTSALSFIVFEPGSQTSPNQ